MFSGVGLLLAFLAASVPDLVQQEHSRCDNRQHNPDIESFVDYIEETIFSVRMIERPRHGVLNAALLESVVMLHSGTGGTDDLGMAGNRNDRVEP
jgi:hypothetical protein